MGRCPSEFESLASANSATPACNKYSRKCESVKPYTRRAAPREHLLNEM